MTEQHPITPPPELVDTWAVEYTSTYSDYTRNYPGEIYIATKAAQWGADQELEACCEWVSKYLPYLGDFPMPEDKLRDARRPKLPSLKEQALEDLGQIDGYAVDQLSAYQIYDDLKRRVSNIRRALEALPND